MSQYVGIGPSATDDGVPVRTRIVSNGRLRAGRRGGPSVVTGRFRIELPETAWITGLSRAHPDVRFRLLTGMAVEDGAQELGEVLGEDADAASTAVETCEQVVGYERMFATDDRVVGQYRTTDTSLYDLLRGASIPPAFPIVVEDGWLELDVTAPRERLRELEANLHSSDRGAELRSLVAAQETEGLLTERQRDLLAAALAGGYYEVPREQTLTEIAEAEGIDPSTASGVLRRAERQLVAQHLAGGDTERR